MANVQVAVADDDPVIAAKIQDLILAEDPHADVAVYRSGEEMLLAGRPFDIVYLDIRMEGADGIETARRLQRRQKDALLIFVSGLRDSVFDALDVHPFHFLLKPLDPERFRRTYREARQAADRFREESGGRFLVKTRQGSVLIPHRDILYIESRSHKLEVHTAEQVYEMYGTLSQAEADLGRDFYRTHRAYLVNLDWVKSYHSDCVVLRNGERIYLSRKKHGKFVKDYMWFLQDQHGGI